jgi:ketosteroid isomerase-like protein
LVDLLADDVEWYTAEGHPYWGGRPWRGPAEVVAHVVDPVNSDWQDYRTRVDQLIASGDEVVTTGRYTGTYKATGRALDAAVCTIYTVREGRIVRFRQWTDTAQFRWVMGLEPVAG